MIPENFMQTETVNRIHNIVRDAVRPFLYAKKYELLDSEEKYVLLCEEITHQICLSRVWKYYAHR